MAKLNTSGMTSAQKAQVTKTQALLKATGGQGNPVSSKSGGSNSSQISSLEKQIGDLKSQATSLAKKQGKSVSWDDSGTATMTAIPLDSLNTNIAPIAVPSPTTPAPTNYESGLSTLGLVRDGSGNWSVPTTPEGNTAQDTFEAYLGSLKAPESTADAYEAARREAGIAKKEQLVNNYKADLANIVNSAKAEQLKLEGQGRGQTSGFIGGEQARISREAAIQALPVEAQLSAAQDDLKTAESKLDTLFKLKVADAEAKNNFYNKIVDTTYKFFSEQEQQKLDTIKQQKADNLTLLRDATGFAQQAALQALKDGNTALFSKITSATMPDINSKTFADDLKRYNSTIMSSIGSSGGSGNGVVSGVVSENQSLANLPAEQKNQTVLTTLLQGKVGQTTKTQVSNALGVLQSLESLATMRQTTGFKGVSPFNALLDVKIPWTDIGIPFRKTLTKKEGIENRQYIDAINLKVQQWASGASLTKTQTEQVERLTPSANDTDNNFRTKMNGLYNFMLGQAQSQLQSEGIKFKPETVNLFETWDLLQKATPEELQTLREAGLIQ